MDEKKGTLINNLDDPEKISEPKLRAIISEVGIELPSKYQTRSYLVSVYNANKERIIEHFKQKHRRKSDSSIVIPDDIPVDPYVEPGPDLKPGAQAAALPLTASKRPGQPQEPKVDKKKAKKANPFQSKKDKTKTGELQPQHQVAASPLPRNTHQGGSATITIPQIDFSQVFPKSPAPGQSAAMVDENQKVLQGLNPNNTGNTKSPGSRAGGSYSTTIMFPQFQPQTPVQSMPTSTPLCATHQQQHRFQSPQPQPQLFQSQAQPKPRSQLFQSQIINSPQPQQQPQPPPPQQQQPQQPSLFQSQSQQSQYQPSYPDMSANTNTNTNMNASSYYCCTPYTQRAPNTASTKPIGFSPFPVATPIGTTTPAPMIQQQPQPQPPPQQQQQFPPLTQQQAPPTVTSYQYPGSVTKLGQMGAVDAMFPPSNDNSILIGNNAGSNAPAENSNALPDDLIFGAKAQQPLSSFSEPPNSFGCSQSSYGNNSTNDSSNNSVKKPLKRKKDNTILYIILFILIILAGVMLRTEGHKIEPFCGPTDVLEYKCRSCPNNAICINGNVKCKNGYTLVDGEFCLNRDQMPGYEFAKRARDLLEEVKFKNLCEEVESDRLTLDKLVSKCGGGISKEDAKEALEAYSKGLGIKIHEGSLRKYSAHRERINYLSMCYLMSKSHYILVGLAVALSLCLFAHFFMTTRNNTRIAREMREKVIELLADARSRARRGAASNDDFLSLANLRCEIVSSSKWGKSRAVQAQWKLSVKLLEKDPRVTKTTIYSNGRNVTGFKLK